MHSLRMEPQLCAAILVILGITILVAFYSSIGDSDTELTNSVPTDPF